MRGAAASGCLRLCASIDRKNRKGDTFYLRLGRWILGSERGLAAKHAVVPEKHLDAAGPTIESVVVRTRDHQVLVLDAAGSEGEVERSDRASEVILLARHQP